MVGEADPPRPRPDRRARAAWVAGALAVAVAIVYADVAHHDFVEFDDDLYLLDNMALRAGLSTEGIAWALRGHVEIDGVAASIWQPLTWLSYLIDYELWGLDSAGPWLLTNVGWHVAATWVLLAALIALTGRFWPSAFVAGVFALHPLQTEAVAWASGRRDVLAGFFFCTTLWAYAAFARRRSGARYAAVFASTAACLASKGTAVALPLVLLLLDVWPLRRLRLPADPGGEPARELVIEKLPLLGLSAAVIGIHLTPVAATAGPWIADPPLLERVADALRAYAATLGRLFWPADLAIVYPTPRQQGLPPAGAGATLVALGAFAAATVGALRAVRSRGYLPVGWIWFFVVLLPVVGLVPAGLRSMHDRYAYVAMIGVALMVGFGGAELAARRRALRAGAMGTAVALLLACALITSRQVTVWRDSDTLFDHTLAATERNAIAHFFRGNARVLDGDWDGARADFEAALAIQPDYVQALQSLAHLYLRSGEPERALPLLTRAVAAHPRWPQALSNLGIAQWQTGARDAAVASWRAALEVAPRSIDARYGLATAHHSRGELDEAIAGYRAVLAIDPQHEAARRGLARARAASR